MPRLRTSSAALRARRKATSNRQRRARQKKMPRGNARSLAARKREARFRTGELIRPKRQKRDTEEDEEENDELTEENTGLILECIKQEPEESKHALDSVSVSQGSFTPADDDVEPFQYKVEDGVIYALKGSSRSKTLAKAPKIKKELLPGLSDILEHLTLPQEPQIQSDKNVEKSDMLKKQPMPAQEPKIEGQKNTTKPDMLKQLRQEIRKHQCSKQDFKAHSPDVDNLGDNSTICCLCGKVYKRLNEHVKTHLRKSESMCITCGEEFQSVSSLQLHVYTFHLYNFGLQVPEFFPHKGVGYKCEECGEVLREVSDLKEHLTTHL